MDVDALLHLGFPFRPEKIMSIRLRRLTSTAITSLVSIQILTFSCLADDWRGWMGNARDGV